MQTKRERSRSRNRSAEEREKDVPVRKSRLTDVRWAKELRCCRLKFTSVYLPESRAALNKEEGANYLATIMLKRRFSPLLYDDGGPNYCELRFAFHSASLYIDSLVGFGSCTYTRAFGKYFSEEPAAARRSKRALDNNQYVCRWFVNAVCL